MLSETGLSVSPDVVVLGFYLNDFLESPGIYLTRLPGPLERSVLAHQLTNVASRLLYLSPSERDELDSPPMLKPPDEIYAWQDEFRRRSTVLPTDRPPDAAAAALQEEVLRHFEDWGGAFSPHVWGKLEGLIAEFARLSREHRFRFRVVAFPVRHQVEATRAVRLSPAASSRDHPRPGHPPARSPAPATRRAREEQDDGLADVLRPVPPDSTREPDRGAVHVRVPPGDPRCGTDRKGREARSRRPAREGDGPPIPGSGPGPRAPGPTLWAGRARVAPGQALLELLERARPVLAAAGARARGRRGAGRRSGSARSSSSRSRRRRSAAPARRRSGRAGRSGRAPPCPRGRRSPSPGSRRRPRARSRSIHSGSTSRVAVVEPRDLLGVELVASAATGESRARCRISSE